jgi:hypothetical protein
LPHSVQGICHEHPFSVRDEHPDGQRERFRGVLVRVHNPAKDGREERYFSAKLQVGLCECVHFEIVVSIICEEGVGIILPSTASLAGLSIGYFFFLVVAVNESLCRPLSVSKKVD